MFAFLFVVTEKLLLLLFTVEMKEVRSSENLQEGWKETSVFEGI